MAVIAHDESAAVFYWKGESLEESWDCILNALIYPEDDGKDHHMNFYHLTLLSHSPTMTCIDGK